MNSIATPATSVRGGASTFSRHLIDLVIVLTQKEVKVRYRSSFLGYLWSLLHPVSFAAVYFFAFRLVLRVPIPNYALFVLTGLFPWQSFASSVLTSVRLFVDNASIIKKVNFPRYTLVMACVFQDLFHLMLAIPVIAVVKTLFHEAPEPIWLIGVPLLLVIQYLTTMGVCLAVSSINLFFRDLERLITIAVSMLFYMTPIIYQLEMVPQPYRRWLALNPLTPIMENWRRLLLEGTISMEGLLLSVVFAGLSLAAGSAVYRKLVWKFAEVL